MIIYLGMIFVVGIACLIYMRFPTIFKNNSNALTIQERYKKAYINPLFWIIIFFLLFPYVVRYYVGTDFDAYYFFYEWHTSLSYDEIFDKRDFGYYLLERINYKISNGNWYYHCAVIGLMVYVPVLYYYCNYSNNLFYSLMIYIFFMQYFVAYNGVRQALAGSMILLGIMFFNEKKIVKGIILFAIAYTFHSTVLIIIPLCILSLLNYKNKILSFIKVAMLFSVVILQNIWGKIIELLEDAGQDKLASDYADVDLSGEKGANILRIAVYLVPVFIVFIFGKRILEQIDSNPIYSPYVSNAMNFIFNAVQFSAIFMIASSKYWIFARIAVYFAIFIPILLSYTYSIFQKKFVPLFVLASFSMFFLYMYLLLPMESNLLPFKTEFGWCFY